MAFTSVLDAVLNYSRTSPEKLCVADESHAYSYQEYVNLIGSISEFFHKNGVSRGDYVVIEATQTVHYLACELACHLIGAVFVPLENKVSAEKISRIADLCDAKIVITAKESGFSQAIPMSVIHGIPVGKVNQESLHSPASSEISEVLFSTGTTGKEKGIVLSHANDIALAENVIAGVDMQKDNVEMIPSPLNHSHALRRYYANMVNGCTVIIVAGVMNVFNFFAMMEKYSVNSIDLVPTALSVLLKLSKGKFSEYQNTLRYIQLGAAPLMEKDKETLKALLPKTKMYNIYGSTESGCICIHEFNNCSDKQKCIGKPACNARIIMVDDDKKEIKSSAENPGTLASFGPMNMLGYFKDEEETNKVLINGFVFSSDEGYYDADGDIILLGRKGDVINTGGYKVPPEEIENEAKKYPGVADCGCIGVEDAMKGKVPKLFIQQDAEAAVDFIKLKAFLAEKLEPYKIPVYYEGIDKIPRTYNGKLLRRELR